jgi:hypothetical protein
MADLITELTDADMRTEWSSRNEERPGDADGTDSDDDGTDGSGGDADGTDSDDDTTDA